MTGALNAIKIHSIVEREVAAVEEKFPKHNVQVCRRIHLLLKDEMNRRNTEEHSGKWSMSGIVEQLVDKTFGSNGNGNGYHRGRPKT